MIPRVLHWIYVGDVSNVSAAYHFWLSSCFERNPGYAFRIWTARECDELVDSRYPDFRQFYHDQLGEKEPALMRRVRQSDFCRLMVLHAFGGIYLDTDFLCVKSFDSLLRHELFVAEEPEKHKQRWRYNFLPSNAIMASVPGHHFWIHQMESFRAVCLRTYAKKAQCLTGPHMIAYAWKRYNGTQPLSVLPTATFFPVVAAVERGLPFDAPRSYPSETVAAHQWGSSYTRGASTRTSAAATRSLPSWLERPVVTRFGAL